MAKTFNYPAWLREAKKRNHRHRIAAVTSTIITADTTEITADSTEVTADDDSSIE